MLRVLDLFSGIGGFSLGLERTGGFETVAFCEIDPYCRAVLRKHWPDVPIHEDIRKLTGVGPVDVICGGYPCQPFSVAGKREGAEDDRHLWPEMYRLVDELRPAWVVGENVAGHISMGLDEVLSDLDALGYAARTFVIPACALDAPHRRDRVWTVAHHDGEQRGADKGKPDTGTDGRHHAGRVCADVADTERTGGRRRSDRNGNIQGWQPTEAKPTCLQPEDGQSHPDDVEPSGEDVANPRSNGSTPRISESRQRQEGDAGKSYDGCCEPSGGARSGFWLPEPDVGRVAHGIPNRVHRLKALGNAVVPQIPEIIGRAILKAEEER